MSVHLPGYHSCQVLQLRSTVVRTRQETAALLLQTLRDYVLVVVLTKHGRSRPC